MMLAWIRNGIARLKPGQVQALGPILGLILFVVLGTRRRVAFANLRADVQYNTQRMTDIIVRADGARPLQ